MVMQMVILIYTWQSKKQFCHCLVTLSCSLYCPFSDDLYGQQDDLGDDLDGQEDDLGDDLDGQQVDLGVGGN